MEGVWWCFGIIFIDQQHKDSLPVLPWIIQPHLRCWRIRHCWVFFLRLGERESCSFSRWRLNACSLFYMKHHLRCMFSCECLVLSELFKFVSELPASALRSPLHSGPHAQTSVKRATRISLFSPKSQFARVIFQIFLKALTWLSVLTLD